MGSAGMFEQGSPGGLSRLLSGQPPVLSVDLSESFVLSFPFFCLVGSPRENANPKNGLPHLSFD